MSSFAKHWIAALLLASGVGLQVGCQACGSCHDYSPPVSNCHCNSCDCASGSRAGSRLSGYAKAEGANAEGDSLDKAVEIAQEPIQHGGLLRR